MIRFGPAGWSYDDWQGVVYPDPRPRGFDPLAYVARFFDTIEINSTFYHPQRPDVTKRWAQRVAENPDFRFTAKLWRRFTHEREEAWGSDDVALVRDSLDPLAEAGRLGGLLVQFPWSFKATDAGSREWLADVLSAFSDYPAVVEIRHGSWERPEFLDWLRERGVGFVNIDQPRFGKSIGPTAFETAPIGYVRLHGRNYDDWFREGAGRDARYDYLYTSEELEPWVERVRELADGGAVEDVYVITNNHYRGQAVANATMLSAMLRGAPVPAPADLVRSFPDVLEGLAEPDAPVQGELLE